MRMGKLPHIFVILVCMVFLLVLSHYMIRSGRGPDTLSDNSFSRESARENARVARSYPVDKGMIDGEQGEGDATGVLSPNGFYHEEPGLSGLHEAPGNRMTEPAVYHHQHRILVKFSPDQAALIKQGHHPSIRGTVGRMVSKGGYYEVFPAEGESVEDLLEYYANEPSGIIEQAQLDYQCALLQNDRALNIAKGNALKKEIDDDNHIDEDAQEGDPHDESYATALEYNDYDDWGENSQADLTYEELYQIIQDPSMNQDIMWYLDTLKFKHAWRRTIGHESVIIAILDTGVAYENRAVPSTELSFVRGTRYVKAPNLEGSRFWKNPLEHPDNMIDDDENGYIDDAFGYDFVNQDGHPNDNNGHGTFLAGLIAGSTSDPEIDTGIARGCTIMNLKVLDYRGIGYSSDIAEAIYYAVDHGARVINLSLAWPSGLEPGPIVKDAITYAAGAGVVVVAGAGNNQEDTICYPAAYQEVFAIGATDYSNKKAYYSSYGKGLDFVAPGGDLNHDLNKDGFPDGILQLTFKTRYRVAEEDDDEYSVVLCDTIEFVYKFLEGTSLSTAEVSGIVGLMLSANPALSGKEIYMILQETARDLDRRGWDEKYGYGLVRADKAVNKAMEQYIPDADNDGFVSVVEGGSDCDDSSPDIHSGAPEIPNDGIDQDCDGFDFIDADGDGFASPQSGGTDCNDHDPSVYPGASDVPNDGIDQDCDGFDFIDADGDGFASPRSGGTDCSDHDPSVYPGAFEIPNDGIDQNCSGEDLVDSDRDGYASRESGGSDCNDADPSIHPGAGEIAGDGIDQDCDGIDPASGAIITDPSAPCSGNDFEAECDSCSNDYEIETECN